MLNRKIVYSLICFLLILVIILGLISYYVAFSKDMKVVFLDVGQGDAVLITQGKNQILIDGGPSGKVIMEKLGENIPFWDRQIEMVIATHPDQDHIGGLISIFDNYDVENVIKTRAKSDSKTFSVFEDKIEGIDEIEAKYGLAIKLPNESELKVVYPFDSVKENSKSNDGSIVLRLDWRNENFLLAGDLPGEIERELLKYDLNLDSRVLKVSHHGSKYSSIEDFLEKVAPEDSIISVGKDNKYDHPNGEVIDRLIKIGSNILRTDKDGDIVYDCVYAEEECFVEPF